MHFDPVPHPLKELWNSWGIEMLVFVSFTLEILLTVFGSRRKYIPGLGIRFTVWSSYLLIGSVVKVIIGKLTTFEIADNEKHTVTLELKALLAPLLLVQLGNPDTITAYSIEDNRLGLRQVISLIFQVGMVVYILVRCWTIHEISYLYLPTFLAGLIKYGESAWALKSALGNSGIRREETDPEANLPTLFPDLPNEIPGLELILKAYYRFDCLKPQVENWLYKPLYDSYPLLSINGYSTEDTFKIIDIELGFMYDVLYTKAPIVYTRIGCILRIISFFSLTSTLCLFSNFFKKGRLRKLDSVYTFVVLITTIIIEVYQIMLLPFSDWAVIEMIRHRNMPGMMQCLKVLGPKSCKWRRWSNLLGQFNLLNFCLHDKPLKFSRSIEFYGKDMEFRRIRNRKRVEFPSELKELIMQELNVLDRERGSKPVSKKGQWALDRHGCLDKLKWSVKRDFDKSIIIWHVATDICYYSDVPSDAANSRIDMSRLLSNYLMYLLAVRPHMLCSPTADVVFHHAYIRLMRFLTTQSPIITDEITACTRLGTEKLELDSDRGKESIVTSKWNFPAEVQELSKILMGLENKWLLISSVWMEMLCYAASNCQLDYHAEQLRRGGGLITHVWLLLAHKTEKFSSSD